MKKKISLLLALLITASFAGCTGGNENSGGASAEPAVTSQISEVSESESSDVSEKSQQTIEEKSEQTESSVVSQSSKKDESSENKVSEPSQTSSESSKDVSKNSVEETTSIEPSKSEPSKIESSNNEPSVQVSSEAPKPESSVQIPIEVSKPESSVVSQVSETSQPTQPTPEPVKPDTPVSNNDIGGMELYEQLFNIENTVTVDISMDKSEIDKLQADYQKYTAKDGNKKSEIYRKANVTVKVGSKSYTIDEVGIRLKGNQSLEPFYSRNGTPNICSFKLSFDETFDDKDEYGSSAKVWNDEQARKARKKRTFATLNELDIKWNITYDNTNIREVYATKLFESANVLVQKIGLSQMKINGNNYGLVKIYEPVDNNFLEKRLPESALDGDLYKCMWSEMNNNGQRTGRWRGATYQLDNSYGIQKNSEGIKYNFNLKTNKKTSKHESLKNFLNVINKSNITKDELEKVLDVDYYAAFMAAEYFAGDPDDIRNNYNNHYIYFRKDNGKAIFIVYDNDRTMGITYGLNVNCAVRNPYSSYAATAGEQANPLISKTISHNPLSSLMYVRDKYADELKKLSQASILTSDNEFNKMYNTAKNNYESIIKPYTRFANQEQDFKFSLDGNRNGGDRDNMSFEQFRSAIMSTYQSAKP